MTREAVAAVLHTLEGLSAREVFAAYGVAGDDLEAVLEETGTPAGRHPLIEGYDKPPPVPAELSIPADLLARALAEAPRCGLAAEALAQLKSRLRALYEAGPGANVEEPEEEDSPEESEEGDEADVVGAHIPIPAETFLEELSQKLEVHPVSIYWLLKEIRGEGARCLREDRERLRDRMTVLVLRLFGHRWPREVEAGAPAPAWAVPDCIIPLVDGASEKTLLDLMRERLAAEAGEAKADAFEREFQEVMGRPLGDWLSNEFFVEHARQFRKRPMAWVLVSGRGSAANGMRRGRRKAAGTGWTGISSPRSARGIFAPSCSAGNSSWRRPGSGQPPTMPPPGPRSSGWSGRWTS